MTFKLSETSQDLKSVLDMAASENVVVEREDGSVFQIKPVDRRKNPGGGVPDDFKGLDRDDIPLDVILEAVRGGRR